MLPNLKQRRDQARSTDDGFTLIELMVVVLIIAILLAIAIPTFLGAQNKAKDRSAQSSLRNALTAAKTIYADTADYTDADTTALAAVEPSLTFNANNAASTGAKIVSIETTATEFWAAALSATGTCFYIHDEVASGGGTEYASDDTTPTCTGDLAQAGTGLTWAASW
jgi:type IV pilus assembly protein PilA